ncbi:MAG: gliding motility lipoprotein GldD [Bacteroidales bacterium]|nr:gliding motility lipoprotein GldD [Bacteroidales bacterium]
MKKILYILSTLIVISSCSKVHTPKPRGYFRIHFPEKEYVKYTENCPYSFEYPIYAKVYPYRGEQKEKYWIDVVFPQFNAEINISYKEVNDTNLSILLDNSWTFLEKHNIKADAVVDNWFYQEEKKVYGAIFEIKGNVASPMQFFLTDSVKHFFRGALYFLEVPNKDSLFPVIEFIKPDIYRLVESLEWKKID